MSTPEATSVGTIVWDVATLAAEKPLEELATSPRTPLATVRENMTAKWSLAAATRGDEIVIAFDAPAGSEAGFAQRVFSRIYAELSRRRSVRR